MHTNVNHPKRARRIVTGAAAAALVAGGVTIAGAGSASAVTTEFAKLSAPGTVSSGQMFTLKCNIGYYGWSGSVAKVKGRNIPIKASRTIGGNSNCTMRLVLWAKGKQQMRVVAIGPQNVLKSQWITVRVR